MKKKLIDTRKLRALAPTALAHVRGGGISTSPSAPANIIPCIANIVPCVANIVPCIARK